MMRSRSHISSASRNVEPAPRAEPATAHQLVGSADGALIPTDTLHNIVHLAFGIAGGALAQDYPTKPIRFLVGVAPGGGTDFMARLVAQKLNDAWNRQVVVVDNRAGAGGVVASEFVARAAPDGYTLVMGTTGTHAINASLYAKPSYHPLRDFVAITPAALLPNMIVAHPSVPVKNIRDLIALARAKPGELSYASSGNFLYLSGALFTSMADIRAMPTVCKERTMVIAINNNRV